MAGDGTLYQASDPKSIMLGMVKKDGPLVLVAIAMGFMIWTMYQNNRHDQQERDKTLVPVIERNTEAIVGNSIIQQQTKATLDKVEKKLK